MSNKSKEASNWMSLSDLMTGLMLVFMLLAVAFMQHKENRTEKFADYQKKQSALLRDLKTEFKYSKDVIVDGDLSIRIKPTKVLFESGDYHISEPFEEILDDFIPRYLSVIMKKEYRDFIREVRIEGHTDDDYMHKNPCNQYDHTYFRNLALSQQRALIVLQYIFKSDEFTYRSNVDKEFARYWFTANGLSYGRMLDDEGDLVFKSKQRPNNGLSRRVEFRIVTNSSELIQQFNFR